MVYFILVVMSLNLLLGFAAVDWFEADLRAWGILPSAVRQVVAKPAVKEIKQVAEPAPVVESAAATPAAKSEDTPDGLDEYRSKLAAQSPAVESAPATGKVSEPSPAPTNSSPTKSVPVAPTASVEPETPLPASTTLDAEDEAFPEELPTNLLSESAMEEIRSAWSEPDIGDEEPSS